VKGLEKTAVKILFGTSWWYQWQTSVAK